VAQNETWPRPVAIKKKLALGGGLGKGRQFIDVKFRVTSRASARELPVRGQRQSE